jgi:hypothetical protein
LLDNFVSLPLIFLAALGVPLLQGRHRVLMLGLWLGFGLYAVTLPYTMYTHNYYNLPLVLPLALSLAAVAAVLGLHLARQPKGWQALTVMVAILAVAYPTVLVRNSLVGSDYRQEPSGWEIIGRELPSDGRIIGLTHDYGYRLNYYGWKPVTLWPSQADTAALALQGYAPSEDFENLFLERTQGYRYFLVTVFGEFENQAELKAYLEEHYPNISEHDSYLLFDLEASKP